MLVATKKKAMPAHLQGFRAKIAWSAKAFNHVYVSGEKVTKL
jgi:hypothetical protein